MEGPPTFKYRYRNKEPTVFFESRKSVFSLATYFPFFRGWFTNDEDLLGGFASDPLGEQVCLTFLFSKLFSDVLRRYSILPLGI